MRSDRIRNAFFSSFTLLCFSLCFSQSSLSEEAKDPNKWLEELDQNSNWFQTATFHFIMKIGSDREAEFVSQQRGEKRLVKILAPTNEQKSILVTGPNNVSVLLPDMDGRVRRVGASNAQQSFLGSDVTSDDLSITRFSDVYQARSLQGDGARIELIVKPGKKAVFPKIRIWVNERQDLITKLQFFKSETDQTPSRTQERKNFYLPQGQGAHEVPSELRFTDHGANHTTTLLLVKECTKFNQNLKDEDFTERALRNFNPLDKKHCTSANENP